MSTRRAAEEFQVPRVTIQDHVAGRVISGSKSGKKHMTDEEEKELVDFLLGSANIGFPQTIYPCNRDVVMPCESIVSQNLAERSGLNLFHCTVQ